MKLKVYYAHFMGIYGTPQEKRDIGLLNNLGFLVINPNHPLHQRACLDEKERGGSGMEYFIALMKSCQCVAFRGLYSGEIPAGVYTEVKAAIDAGMPVFELPSGILRRGLDIEQTREVLHEIGER